MENKKITLENSIGFDFSGNNPRNTHHFHINKNQKIKALEQSVLGHASNFFRFDQVFFLEKVIPLFKDEELIRFWSAACSHGCEPYTINMIMKENLPHQQIKILGTDIGEVAVRESKIGVWQDTHLRPGIQGHKAASEGFIATGGGVPDEYLKKYFEVSNTRVKTDWGRTMCNDRLPAFKLRDDILKEDIEIKIGNLLYFTPNDKQHVVMANNVLSYFSKNKQIETINRIYDILVDNGVLYVQDQYQNNFKCGEHINTKFKKLSDYVYQKM